MVVRDAVIKLLVSFVLAATQKENYDVVHALLENIGCSEIIQIYSPQTALSLQIIYRICCFICSLLCYAFHDHFKNLDNYIVVPPGSVSVDLIPSPILRSRDILIYFGTQASICEYQCVSRGKYFMRCLALNGCRDLVFSTSWIFSYLL